MKVRLSVHQANEDGDRRDVCPTLQAASSPRFSSFWVWLSLLLLASPVAFAQPAEDYFHNGAQSYLSNNIPKAKEIVEAGLKQFPQDVKLKKLEELLKQQSQQQSSQQDQKDQQQQQQQQQDQQKQDQKDQQQSQAEKKQEEEKQPPAQAGAQQDKKEPSEKEQEQEAKTEPGQMTPQEARQLLDAQKGDEKMMPLDTPAKPQDSSRPFKDW